MMAEDSDKREEGGNEAELPAFEPSLAEVQQIIDQMESGEISLEKSLDHYTRGMKLIQHCNQILERAEQRFQQLRMDEQGGRLEEADAADSGTAEDE